MEQAIRDFNKQFLFKPKIENAGKLQRRRGFVVGGVGGSSLAAGLLAGLKPEAGIVLHRDYGVPALPHAAECLHIASSYSGDTEETIDFARSALQKGYALAAISVGGRLLKFAEGNALPYVALPDTKIQPRAALGFQSVALAALMGDKELEEDMAALGRSLRPDEFEEEGKKLSKELQNSVPVIYSSARNSSVAYTWKIKLNETGKIPAFCNVFPELNHNEMTGFDSIKATEGLSRNLRFVFLEDRADHSQIQTRMRVCKKLYEERGFRVLEAPMAGSTALEKIFASLLLADWTALLLSRFYGTEADQVPMVETFKKLITDDT